MSVSLELPPGVDLSTLSVPGLVSLNGDPGLLTGVSIAPSGPGTKPVLNIRVPDGQAPGTYSGVVIDSQIQEPRGMLSIRIS